jgi:hypothetical protein
LLVVIGRIDKLFIFVLISGLCWLISELCVDIFFVVLLMDES